MTSAVRAHRLDGANAKSTYERPGAEGGGNLAHLVRRPVLMLYRISKSTMQSELRAAGRGKSVRNGRHGVEGGV